jgi:hypothetical protein
MTTNLVFVAVSGGPPTGFPFASPIMLIASVPPLIRRLPFRPLFFHYLILPRESSSPCRLSACLTLSIRNGNPQKRKNRWTSDHISSTNVLSGHRTAGMQMRSLRSLRIRRLCRDPGS